MPPKENPFLCPPGENEKPVHNLAKVCYTSDPLPVFSAAFGYLLPKTGLVRSRMSTVAVSLPSKYTGRAPYPFCGFNLEGRDVRLPGELLKSPDDRPQLQTLFRLHNKGIHLCIYTIHSFPNSFPIEIITEYWGEFLVLSLLTNHSIYHSVHMPIPNPPSPRNLSPWVTMSQFSKSVSQFLHCQ